MRKPYTFSGNLDETQKGTAVITLFNRKTVYLGCDLKQFSAVRDTLAAHGVDYAIKTKNRMGQWTGRGTLRGQTGSLGQPADAMYEYEVFVHKDDYEKAMHLIQGV